MWAPLLSELINKPWALVFGYGFFGMIQSDAYIFSRDFYQASHAHNAYINLLVDAGLIVLLPFILIFISLFKKAISIGRRLNSPIYYGLLGSIFAYIVAAFSGRQFFPTLDNMMLFPIIALLVIYTRLTQNMEVSS
jgi:O-antigen ligase